MTSSIITFNIKELSFLSYEENKTTTVNHYYVTAYEEVNVTIKSACWGGFTLSFNPNTEGSFRQDVWYYLTPPMSKKHTI
jgi:hypothetical protein